MGELFWTAVFLLLFHCSSFRIGDFALPRKAFSLLGFIRHDPGDSKLRFKQTIKIDQNLKQPVDSINISSQSLDILRQKGFQLLTPVQSQSFHPIFSGIDVVARSRTGTGKTFAFGLPLIEKLSASLKNPGSPSALILEPTRELAEQVANELRTLCSANSLRIDAIFGGASFQNQLTSIRKGIDVVVSTTGRLLDHIGRGTINLCQVRHVILDEGDTMLEMGFQEDVDEILARCSQAGALKPQMLLYSATMPGWICDLTEKHMNDPVFLDAVDQGESRLADTIKHFSLPIPASEHRVRAIASVLEDVLLTLGARGQAIIFCDTKDQANELMLSSCFGQLKCMVLHGDIEAGSRQKTLRHFKEKRIDVLIATDVAARGLDISGVELVVHTAPSLDVNKFVHRSGRTGRAGRNGTSLVLHEPNEQSMLGNLERKLNFRFSRMTMPTAEEVTASVSNVVLKKLDKVDAAAASVFSGNAKKLLDQVLRDPEAMVNKQLSAPESVVPALKEPEPTMDREVVENLLARFMASLANRDMLQVRSMLTRELGQVTLEMELDRSIPASQSGLINYIKEVCTKEFGPLHFFVTKYQVVHEAGRERLLFDVSTESAEDILNSVRESKNGNKWCIQKCSSAPDVDLQREVAESRTGYSYRGAPRRTGYGMGSDRPRSRGGRPYEGGSTRSFQRTREYDRGGRGNQTPLKWS